MNKLIDKISLPAGLRNLQIPELEQVCKELRDELIETISKAGGHFASSLGATEITVALHHVFNTPQDKIVWDTGHQAYVHKMVTGRRDKLASIRQKDGLCGFLSREESEYDAFGAGHAGTSVSAAVGMLEALNRIDPSRKVIACIGDGALTAGMVFEALNHAGILGKNLIVVLNDNEMSISPNVGAISWLFSKAVTSKASNIVRTQFKKLYEKGYVPSIVYNAIDRAEEAAQGFFMGPAMLFEAFGFRYIGPVDGHNVSELIVALNRAKEQDVPVLVHAYTVKGKGYEPAEDDPVKWHGVTPFDREQGEFLSVIKPSPKKIPTYTGVFAQAVCDLCKVEPKVVAITAAMASGTGLDKLEKENPSAFYDVGICEQHAVTFAAGLACEGYKPIVAIYSTFLQRGFDQIVHDVAIQKLPVVFAMDRGGVVGNDGHTHQGVFDIAFLRSIPNMTIMSPKDENELRQMLFTALRHEAGPTAIRYPRGNCLGLDIAPGFKELPIGKVEPLRAGDDGLLIAFGPMVQTALQIAERLSRDGIEISVVNARFAKPLDLDFLSSELPKYPVIATLEDHAIQGGFGSAVLEAINDLGIQIQSPIQRFGVQDAFVPHATQGEQYVMNGYDSDSIFNFLAKRCAKKTAANAA